MSGKRLVLLTVVPALLLPSCALLPILDSGSAERDETGTIVDIGVVNVFSFQVGDCLLDLEVTAETQELFDAGSEAEIIQGGGVPCSSTHTYEVYHVEPNGIQSAVQLNDVTSIADDICYENFEAFAGISYESTSLDFLVLFPTEESFATGDAEITCLIHLENLAMTTGSLQGKGPSFLLEVANDFRAEECLSGLDGDSLLGAAPQQVSCENPHLWEVYYVGYLDDDLEPPLDFVAEEMCLAAYTEFIGLEWENSRYTFSWHQPSEESYRFGDRKVACVAHTEDNTPVSGSLKGVMQ